jgi:hypothetical protein
MALAASSPPLELDQINAMNEADDEEIARVRAESTQVPVIQSSTQFQHLLFYSSSSLSATQFAQGFSSVFNQGSSMAQGATGEWIER